ncbi:hypothetical protein ACPCAG_30850 [Streptomyces pseudogriseolus]|uniref:hypothetical protein n=1 Tax=Streptomyces pseudogriseolus TaxID=36817 RepID=UPI003FA2FD05
MTDSHSANGAAPRRVLRVHWWWLRNWQPLKRNPRPWPDDMEEWLAAFAPPQRDDEGPVR